MATASSVPSAVMGRDTCVEGGRGICTARVKGGYAGGVGAKVTCGFVKSNSSTVTVSLSLLNPPLIPLNRSHVYGSLISLRGVEFDGLYPLI